MATACPVRIIYGASDLTLNDVVRQSVATIHIWTRDVLNAPWWCVPFVNGERVGRLHRVLPGDTLEFIYPWGFKGGDDLMSSAELMQWRRVTPEQYEELLHRGLPSTSAKDGSRLHRREEVHRWFAVVPPGAPSWVKADRIAETIRVWQPRYQELLTPDDALEILLNARNLLDVLFPLNSEGKEAGR